MLVYDECEHSVVYWVGGVDDYDVDQSLRAIQY